MMVYKKYAWLEEGSISYACKVFSWALKRIAAQKCSLCITNISFTNARYCQHFHRMKKAQNDDRDNCFLTWSILASHREWRRQMFELRRKLKKVQGWSTWRRIRTTWKSWWLVYCLTENILKIIVTYCFHIILCHHSITIITIINDHDDQWYQSGGRSIVSVASG